MITEGKMQYLFDEKGRRYLDVSTLPLDLVITASCSATSMLMCHSSSSCPVFWEVDRHPTLNFCPPCSLS